MMMSKMTMSESSERSMLEVFEAHKNSMIYGSSAVYKQVANHFTPQASIVCVPTAAGGSGAQVIGEFIKLAASRAHLMSEEVVSRMVGSNHIVEESILTIAHDEMVEWLLPGVKPTKRTLVVPIVTICRFTDENKIYSKTVYWDQGSVLRQASILPRSLYSKATKSEVVLPVLDSEIAHGVRTGKPEPNMMLLQASSGVPLEPVSDSIHAPVMTPGKNRMAAQGAFPQGDMPASRPVSSRPVSNMSALLSGELGAETPRPSSRVLAQPGGKSSNIFDDAPLPTNRGIAADPRRYQSNIDFGAGENAPVHKHLLRRDPNWSSQDWSSNNSMTSEVRKNPHPAHHPSDESVSSDFNEENVPRHTGKRINPHSNESHFSMGTNAPEAADGYSVAQRSSNRRDPNAMSSEMNSRPSSR